MAFIRYQEREIVFKIVYAGCSGAGRATNFEQLARLLDPTKQTPIIRHSNRGDILLRLEFQIEPQKIFPEFRIRFELITFTGMIRSRVAAHQLFHDTDGIVWVVDSSWTKMKINAETGQRIHNDVQSHGLSLDLVALVLQYNKRDLSDAAPCNYLDFAFNSKGFSTVEAAALEGRGVVETLETVCQKVVQNYSENKFGVAPPF